MEQHESIELQLWEYIDGTSPDADKARIAHLIATDPLWSAIYKGQQALHTALHTGMDTEQPSLRFTKNVMDAVAQTQIAPATRQYINKGIISGIAAIFIISFVAFSIYLFTQASWNTHTTSIFANLKFNSAIFANSAIINIAIGANVILALLLADQLLKRKRAHNQ